MASVRVRPDTGTLFLDFRYQGKRCRELTTLQDNRRNRKRLEAVAERIEAEITLEKFDYAKTFPNSKRAQQFAQKSAEASAAPVAAGDLQEPPARPSTPLFKDFAEEWFMENEPTWKRSYQKRQADIFGLHLRPRFGEQEVGDIQKSEILKFRAQLAKASHGRSAGLSPSRINQILHLLKQIVDEAADRFDFITPFRGIKPMRVGRTQIDPFSLEEVQKFLNTVDPRWRAYYVVRFFTGMRTSEVDGLKWEYVDFERREILIRETLVHGHEDTPKTDGSHRSIHMSQMVMDALHQQWEQRRCKHYVFASARGKPLHYHNVNHRIWYPTLKAAGLKRRNPYQTRHTAATFWLAAGESPEWIALQMGHANTKMLFTVYSRYVPNLTRQDGSAMEHLLNTRLGDVQWGAQQ